LGVAGGSLVREKLACGAVPICSREETVGAGADAVSLGADSWAEAIPLAGSFVGVAGTGGSIGAAAAIDVFIVGGDSRDLTDEATGTRSFFIGTGAGGLGDAVTGGGVIFLGAGTGVGARSVTVGEDNGISGGSVVFSCAVGFAEAISVVAPSRGAGFFCNSII